MGDGTILFGNTFEKLYIYFFPDYVITRLNVILGFFLVQHNNLRS
jgi:hypothetical protein